MRVLGKTTRNEMSVPTDNLLINQASLASTFCGPTYALNKAGTVRLQIGR